MEINIIQALLIGLWTAFCFSGLLLGLYTNRCIILSFGVGIILGDLPTALAMGAISELAYMGFGVGAGDAPFIFITIYPSELIAVSYALFSEMK